MYIRARGLHIVANNEKINIMRKIKIKKKNITTRLFERSVANGVGFTMSRTKCRMIDTFLILITKMI